MNVSTLINPAVKQQPEPIMRPAGETCDPQNHWAWSGWVPEEDGLSH